MPVSLPHTIDINTLADAIEVNDNFLALQAKFNGGIVDGDVAANANILGSKLANASTPGGKIQSNTITSTQVGIAPNGLNANNINANVLTRNQVSITAGQTLRLNNIDMLVQLVAISGYQLGALPGGGGNLTAGATLQQLTWWVYPSTNYMIKFNPFWNDAGTFKGPSAVAADFDTGIVVNNRALIGLHHTQPAMSLVGNSWQMAVNFTISHIEKL